MEIRLAVPTDALAVARLHVRSWQAAYRNLLPADYLNGLRPEERAQRYEFGRDDPSKPTTIVAVDAAVVVGFSTVAPARDTDVQRYGELCALHVDPDRLGEGIGLALMTKAYDALRMSGFRDTLLWVLMGNERAAGFYRRHGWSADNAHRRAAVWGIEISEIRFRRPLPGAG